jgi:hypothetical protein
MVGEDPPQNWNWWVFAALDRTLRFPDLLTDMVPDPMTRLPPKCTVALLTLSGALGAGCRPHPPAAPSQGRPLTVVVSGDTAGWIVPCGCTSNQSGGLPRRATYLAELAAESEVLVADVGGAPAGKSTYDRLKFEAILQGELAMGVAAHNLGASEAALGPDYLREVARRLHVPFVSTNVLFRDGQPPTMGTWCPEPLRIVQAAGRSVAVLGVLSPKFATAGLRVTPPREAVLQALRQAAQPYQAVILLAYVPEDELQPLAEGLPEVDVVVGGPTGQPVAPRHVGPTLLLSATKQGKFLARLDAPLDANQHWTGGIVELSDRFADDPAQAANVAQFRRELGRRDLTPADTSFGPRLPLNMPKEFAVGGTKTCLDCHKPEAQVWSKSRHALAWKSLQEHDAQVDPECQRCHTTGYGLPGGFVSIAGSPALVDAGCENCHGPSKEHDREPKIHTGYFAQAANQCIACHDRENSPGFDFDAYWAKIKHGKEHKNEEKR